MTRHYNDLSYLGAEAPNVDKATGIRYGFIHVNSVMGDALDDITQGTNLAYEAAVEEAKERIADALHAPLDDLGVLPYAYPALEQQTRVKALLDELAADVWARVEDSFNDHYESDNSSYRYEQDGYVIEYTPGNSLACLTVLKSPYYTWAAFGSPCIPNAGDLDTPRAEDAGGIKTYCLGPDWFEDELAPYPVEKVD